MFSQAAHQVDVVRLLGGGQGGKVRAQTGEWDAARPTEGAYSALLTFEDGAFASLVYSGYAHFDSDELAGWIGERDTARIRTPTARRACRLAKRHDARRGAALKNARAYGGPRQAQDAAPTPAALHNQFGLVIASCDRADLRPMADGVMVYDDTRTWQSRCRRPRSRAAK